ncbi:hypothetical protein ASG87_14340 [Frateuria sp. Soil773]|uniref:hypothetical protein n=1 Tax=Frateuria sp. Soil773 TaxID=1736407 RepID=UPI0006FE3E1E|nr:hypothetical protein [Frateuria sp. Soil773]KRE98572.1 hypothetical protein ASG87_14340 [Frateuria sp. Soil773]
MAYLFLLAIGLTILWLPTYTVALMLHKLGVPRPFADLRAILPAQLLLAIGLIALADRLGLGNPAGSTLAAIVLVSVAGAFGLWRWRRPRW